MSELQIFFTLIIITIATLLTRFLPFFVFPEGKSIPNFVQYLGQVLPYAVMGMLVVYCLRNVKLTSLSSFLPELIAILCIVVLHNWRKNTLFSIAGGTLIYMFMVQVIF